MRCIGILVTVLLASGAALGQDWHWPVDTQSASDSPEWVISAAYNDVPLAHTGHRQFAIDFKHRTHYYSPYNENATFGKRVLSAAAGRIVNIDRSVWKGGWYGRQVIIRHGNFETVYAHLDTVSSEIKEDQDVPAHMYLGTIGSTGFASNAHLHFEVRAISTSSSVRPEPIQGEGDFYRGFPVRHEHNGSNASQFIADLSYPDGTVVPAGSTFQKKWQIRNSGTSRWYSDVNTTAGYRWAFDGGNQLGGPSSIPISPEIGVGQSFVAEVQLQAPSTPGTYRGYWRMRAPSGQTFGTRVWVEIVVSAGSEVLIDNSNEVNNINAVGFFKWGTEDYWHPVGGYGINGSMLWTRNNNPPEHPLDNVGQWRPNLSASRNYEVYAFIPRNYATTTDAHYEIWSNGQHVNTAHVNQNILYDVWTSLGTYYFPAGSNSCVRILDITSELWNSRYIGVDAVKFVPR